MGWTTGRVCHAVEQAEDGSRFWACYFRHSVPADEGLRDEPDISRACGRTTCRSRREESKRLQNKVAVA